MIQFKKKLIQFLYSGKRETEERIPNAVEMTPHTIEKYTSHTIEINS